MAANSGTSQDYIGKLSAAALDCPAAGRWPLPCAGGLMPPAAAPCPIINEPDVDDRLMAVESVF
jgi:hypothetical protein